MVRGRVGGRSVVAGLTHPAIGVLLLGLLAGWALQSRPDARSALTEAGAIILVAVGLVVGMLMARAHPAVPGILVALAVAVVVSLTAPDSLSGSPLAPPLGYGNADGALLLAAAAGVVTAASSYSLAPRLASALVASAAAAVTWSIHAQAAAVGCALLVVWVLARPLLSARVWAAGAAALVLSTTGATVVWAAGWVAPPAWALSALSPDRFALWGDAWQILSDHPVSGVGAGEFARVSPTAAGDLDLQWAHSFVLQIGADLGWVGLALLLLLVAWGIVTLGRDAPVLAVLLLPASVDYVLQFGWVLLAFSLVLGGVSGRSGTGNPWLTPPSP